MNDQEIMERMQEESFAQLLADNPIEKDWLQPGQQVEAVIVKIAPEWVFIDLGSKSEGYLDRKEFIGSDGTFTVKEGDLIKVYFLSSRNNERLFTTKVGRGDNAKAFLEDAWSNGIPVEGKISKEIKGGIEVIIAGHVRAFCPFSQTGISRSENIADYIGKILLFHITEYSEKGRNIVLSHRLILERETDKKKEYLKETLQEGMSVHGRVISIRNFGAFVDIGGIQGLLPLSELGWDRSEIMKDILAVGDELTLSIVKLDWDSEKITLSRKAMLPNPWENIVKNFPIGSVTFGSVASLTNFGAFISLGKGIEGLIHISKLGNGKRIKHTSEVLTAGQTVEVQIEAIDSEKKRISLSLAHTNGDEQPTQLNDYASYLGISSTSFGSLGDTLKNRLTSKLKQ